MKFRPMIKKVFIAKKFSLLKACYKFPSSRLRNIFLALILFLSALSAMAQLPTDFQKIELLTNLSNATTMQFAPDGRIFILDRYGEVIIYKTDTQTSVSAGTVPVFHEFEDGLLGIAFDPNFITNNFMYLHYAVLSSSMNRVSRFTMNGDTFDLSSEVVMLEWATQRTLSFHSGGDMGFDSQGNLYIAVGDNTDHGEYGAHNESDNSKSAEKSSGNTNDLRGSILRITPQANGTYTIPAGNLFSVGTPNTKPEIYVMGARNPYRIFVDKDNTDWLFWGEVGPDANNPGSLGPEGLDEMNLVKTAGNYGWPYFSGVDNDAYQIPYRTPAPFYNDPAVPENASTWNTGAAILPPAQSAWLEFFHGSYFAGPRYYHDASLTGQQRLPVEFDDAFFYYDFNTSEIWVVKMDINGNVLSNEQMAPSVFPQSSNGFIDMEIGPDGHMYILEYGTGCCPQNVGTGKLVRVDYTGVVSNTPPLVVINTDLTSGSLPLTVNFSSDGTIDPNGDMPLSYAWDFQSDGTVDSTQEAPTFTFTTAGTFNVQLKVNDNNGGVGVQNVLIHAGNNAATFVFNSPVDGGFMDWSDDINFNLTINDLEDGSTSNGIDCNDIEVIPSLGHLNHFHDGATIDGCPQILTLDPGSHDTNGEMDIYYVLNANYTDQGGLTAVDQMILHPKRKEAEFYIGGSGITKIANTDAAGGGSEAIRVDHGGNIGFSGRNLLNMNAVKYRVAAEALGGTIEFRIDNANGPLLATTNIPVTGSANNWIDVESSFTDPGGKHDIFFIFKNNPGQQDIFDLNYIEFIGPGVSIDNSPPEVNQVVAVNATTTSVEFSEYVSQATAQQNSNYSIDQGITISSAVLQADNRTVILTHSTITAGTSYQIEIANVQNLAGLSVIQDNYPLSIFDPIRINVGGPQTIASGNTFIDDQFATGGSLFSRTVPIANTVDDELYQTERFNNFTYSVPLPITGDYDIRLHFAELYFGVNGTSGGVGSRIFNVLIEGNQVLTDFDISAEVGPATALIKEFDNVSITDGFATIQFSSVVENPKVSAIEILPADTFSIAPTIAINSPSSGSDVNQPFDVSFIVQNWDIAEGSTHMHYYIDGNMVGPHYNYGPITIHNLNIGSHTIRLELFEAGHIPTGIYDEITVNVTDQTICNSGAFPDQWQIHQLQETELPYRHIYILPHEDLDGDGFKDIVAGAWWYKNPGVASGSWVQNTVGPPLNNISFVYDFDGDGDMDLFGTQGTYTGFDLAWAENNGSGNFTVHTNIPSGATSYSEPLISGIAGGVFQNGGSYQMAINWNGAESTGSPVQMLTVPADPANTQWTLEDISSDSLGEDLKKGDIDGDGDLDLFQSSNWLRNEGDGSWTTVPTGISYVTTPDRAQLVDFDGDGDLDAVVGQLGLGSNSAKHELAWFEAPADPTQNWAKHILATDINGSLSLFTSDIDFDGDKDIIVGEWKGDNRLIAFQNDLCNSGTWIRKTIDAGGTGFDHHDGAQVVDIDNDGDLDIASIGWDNVIPRIFENTTGSVQEPTWIDNDDVENYIARHECGFVQAGDKFYLIGGSETAITNVFDYGTNTWSAHSNPAPVLLNHFQAVEYQGLIWVIGALQGSNFPSGNPADYIWAFDPTAQEWIQGPEIPSARKRGSAGLVVYNDKFYLLAGSTNGHDGGYVPWFDEYDPATGTWTSLQDAPHARDHFHAAVIGNKLYAVGGRLSGGPDGGFKPNVPEVDVYDFANETWETLPATKNLPLPRASAHTAVFNEKLVVFGGSVQDQLVDGVLTTGSVKLMEEFDPISETWRRLENTVFERRASQAIVSGNGIFLAAGSNVIAGGNQKNMEYYGENNPVGTTLVQSVLSAPSNLDVPLNSNVTIPLEVSNGNVGVMITSMELTGADASDFSIQSGALTGGLLKANTVHDIVISTTASMAGKAANLTINYGASGQLTVDLISTGGTPGSDEIWLEAECATIGANWNVVTDDASASGNEYLTPPSGNNFNSAPTDPDSWVRFDFNAEAGPYTIYGLVKAPTGNNDSFWVRANGGEWVKWNYIDGSVDFSWHPVHFKEQRNNIIVYDLIDGLNTVEFAHREEGVGLDKIYIAKSSGLPTGFGDPDSNCNPTTQAPVVDAGSNQTISLPATTSAIFNGSANDPDGGAITHYEWAQISGPNTADLNGEDAADLTVTGLAVGSYVFRLTVTDDDDETGFDEVALVVQTIGGTDPPIANSGEDQSISGTNITLNGSGNDPDGGIITYLWTQQSGPSTATLANVTTADLTASNLEQGDYVFRLTVTDDENDTTFDEVTVTVLPESTGQDEIWLEAECATVGSSWGVITDAAASGGEFLMPPAGNNYSVPPTDPNSMLSFDFSAEAGTYTIYGLVRTPSGDDDSFWVRVNGGTWLKWNYIQGSTNFSWHPVHFKEQINNIVIYDLVAGINTIEIAHREDGVGLDKLYVTKTGNVPNGFGGTDTSCGPIMLSPIVDAGSNQNISLPTDNLTLNGSSSDPDGGPVTYLWTQQSGPGMATLTNATTADLTVSSLEEGDYVFRLTVTDDENDTAFDEVTVSVLPEVTNPSCTWNDLSDSFIKRFEAVSQKVGNRLYVLGGFTTGILAVPETEIYDVTTDVWSIGASMPIPVTHTAAIAVGTDIWIIAGFAGDNPGVATNAVQIYNTLTDSWSVGPALPNPVGSGAGTLNGNKIHYVGGLLPDRTTNVGDHLVLDLSNLAAGWTMAAAMPDPRNHHSVMSVNGIIYAIGGQFGHDGPKQDTVLVHAYDPNTDEWTRMADLSRPRSHFKAATTIHNGKIIIAGGVEGNLLVDDVTQYDPQLNLWTELCKLPEGLEEAAAQAFGDRLIVSGGRPVANSNILTKKTRWLQLEQDVSQPPVADAGLNQSITLPSNSLIINGSGFDPDGGSVTFLWTQQNGPSNATFSNATTADLTASNLEQGNYVFRLTVTDDENATAFDETTVTILPEPTSNFTLRINTGGTQTTYAGEEFIADQYFDTGRTLDRPQTGLPEPYQTFRYSRSQQMAYDIPVPDGEYTINLHFAELWFGATGGGTGGVGSRVFDVSMEGQLVEDNLDVFAEVGADAMLIKTHTVTVTGGVLNIDFSSLDANGGERHPIINAIEILGNNGGGSGKLAISKKEDDNAMSIYPNQAATFVTASFEEPTEVQQVLVFDITGRLVKSYDPYAIKDGEDYTVDVKLYQQGTYIIKMVDNVGTSFQKRMLIIRQ